MSPARSTMPRSPKRLTTRRPFELRRPITCRHQDRDLGQFLREAGAEPDMRAELVRVVGKARALQPDMHRRRHRAARPGLAIVPDAPLFVVETAFVQLLVTRHVGSLPVGMGSPQSYCRVAASEEDEMERRKLGALEVSA